MELTERPLCDYCDDPVSGDHYYEINGDVICDACMNEYFRKEVEEE